MRRIRLPRAIAGVASGPWQIEFEPVESGIVTIAWGANHGITDLAAIARGAGIEHVAALDSPMDFGEAAVEALERDDLSVIVARVKAVGPDNYGMDLALPENAFQFKRCVQERKAAR